MQCCTTLQITQYSPNIQQISAAKVAGICFFFWLLLWQDSQKCWHYGHHFTNLVRELCPLQTSTHRIRSTLRLPKHGSSVIKQRPAAFGIRSGALRLPLTTSVQHCTKQVGKKLTTCFVSFMPACGFTLSLYSLM